MDFKKMMEDVGNIIEERIYGKDNDEDIKVDLKKEIGTKVGEEIVNMKRDYEVLIDELEMDNLYIRDRVGELIDENYRLETLVEDLDGKYEDMKEKREDTLTEFYELEEDYNKAIDDLKFYEKLTEEERVGVEEAYAKYLEDKDKPLDTKEVIKGSMYVKKENGIFEKASTPTEWKPTPPDINDSEHSFQPKNLVESKWNDVDSSVKIDKEGTTTSEIVSDNEVTPHLKHKKIEEENQKKDYASFDEDAFTISKEDSNITIQLKEAFNESYKNTGKKDGQDPMEHCLDKVKSGEMEITTVEEFKEIAQALLYTKDRRFRINSGLARVSEFTFMKLLRDFLNKIENKEIVVEDTVELMDLFNIWYHIRKEESKHVLEYNIHNKVDVPEDYIPERNSWDGERVVVGDEGIVYTLDEFMDSFLDRIGKGEGLVDGDIILTGRVKNPEIPKVTPEEEDKEYSQKPIDDIQYELTEKEMVNHPDHYNKGGLETIDILEATLTSEEYKGFLKGNILKYRDRAPYKDNPQQDYKKAKFYMYKLKETE